MIDNQSPEQEKQGKGQFVQFPFHLIYGQSELTRDDKWVLLAIMGKCWTNNFYPLSYREIESLSTVPITLLTSYQDKKTDEFHEGILDRLARLEYIQIASDKETNPITGKPKGQTKTFISINHTRMWQQNKDYYETSKSVSNANTSVSITNASASITNTSVSNANDSVCDPRTNGDTYISQINIDTKEKNIYLPNGKEKSFPFSEVSFSEEDNATFPEEKPTSKPLTSSESAILDWWDTTQAIPTNRAAKGIKKPLESIATLIDKGHVTIEMLGRARTHMLTRKNSFCRDNTLNLFLFDNQLQGALTEMKTINTPKEPTEQDLISKELNEQRIQAMLEKSKQIRAEREAQAALSK